jgi:hypothetical protein
MTGMVTIQTLTGSHVKKLGYLLPDMAKSGLFGNQNRPNNILRPLFRPNKYKYTKRKNNNIKQ